MIAVLKFFALTTVNTYIAVCVVGTGVISLGVGFF